MMDQDRGSFLHLRLSQAKRVRLSRLTFELGQPQLALLDRQCASDDFHAQIALRSQAGDFGTYPLPIGKRFAGLNLRLWGHPDDAATAVRSWGRNAVQEQERCDAHRRRGAPDPHLPTSLCQMTNTTRQISRQRRRGTSRSIGQTQDVF